MFNKKLFKSLLIMNELTVKDLALALGVNEVTIYRKIRKDGDFTRSEIQKICETLNINDPNIIIDLFFYRRLTETQV